MYLGIDVSKLTIDCCLISDGLFFERKFKNSQAGFQDLKDWLKKTAQQKGFIAAAKQQGNTTKQQLNI